MKKAAEFRRVKLNLLNNSPGILLVLVFAFIVLLSAFVLSANEDEEVVSYDYAQSNYGLNLDDSVVNSLTKNSNGDLKMNIMGGNFDSPVFDVDNGNGDLVFASNGNLGIDGFNGKIISKEKDSSGATVGSGAEFNIEGGNGDIKFNSDGSVNLMNFKGALATKDYTYVFSGSGDDITIDKDGKIIVNRPDAGSVLLDGGKNSLEISDGSGEITVSQYGFSGTDVSGKYTTAPSETNRKTEIDMNGVNDVYLDGNYMTLDVSQGSVLIKSDTGFSFRDELGVIYSSRIDNFNPDCEFELSSNSLVLAKGAINIENSGLKSEIDARQKRDSYKLQGNYAGSGVPVFKDVYIKDDEEFVLLARTYNGNVISSEVSSGATVKGSTTCETIYDYAERKGVDILDDSGYEQLTAKEVEFSNGDKVIMSSATRCIILYN